MRKLTPRVVHATLIAGLLLAVIAGLSAVALHSLTPGMRESLGRQEQLRAQAMAERFDGLLSARRLALAALADSLPGPAGRTTAVLQQALAAQSSLSGAFLNVALFTRNGDLVYSARPPVSRLYVAGTRPYFIEVVQQKRELLSQPFNSALTGTPVVVFALPVLDAHGEVEYVLAASLALAEAPMSSQLEVDGRLPYVMTSDGYLVSYPQRARLTRHVNEVPELSPEAGLGLQGFQGWRLSDDSSRVTAFARLRQAPWIVGLQAPERLVFASLEKAREQLLLAAAVFAALAIAASWPLSRFTARSLAQPQAQAAAAAARAPTAAPSRSASPATTASPAAAHTAQPTAPASTAAPYAQPAAPTSTAAAFAAQPSAPAAPASPAAASSTQPAAPALSTAASSAQPTAPTQPATAVVATAAAGQPAARTLDAAARSEAASTNLAAASALPASDGAPANPGDTPGAGRESARTEPELDLDAFMRANFTNDEQRRAFISTVSASVRKLPAEVGAVANAMRTEPARATAVLHTLKGAWGSLGAREFAKSAATLEAAIKAEQPTATPRADFERHAAQLRTDVEGWLGAREKQIEYQPVAAPPASLLPLLRERNIGAATLYDTARPYWDKLLGPHAPEFSAAMDVLDFQTAERLLSQVPAQAEESQRS
jgi:HPt (histidine-containing phosphotransfer) domain-containing protein